VKPQSFTHIETTEKVVALTFDDGPYLPYTPQVLSILEKYDAKATFYFQGTHIEENFDCAVRAHQLGHELGNHSYSHRSFRKRPPTSLYREIVRTDKLLEKIGVDYQTTFRPPFGEVTFMLGIILWKLNKKVIYYSVVPKEHELITPENIHDYCVKNVFPGSVIVLHDGGKNRENTVLAVEMIVKTLTEKGYSFKTISDLFGFGNGH